MQIAPKYLTTKQAAEYLGMSESTLENYRYSGIGPAFIKHYRLVKYEPSALDEWMKAGTRQTKDQARP